MSYTKSESLGKKISDSVRSPRRFGFHFLKGRMIGQKGLLYNEALPRIINISPLDFTCMYACKMCPYSQKDVRDLYSKKKEMDWETIEAIVESFPNDPHYSFDISAFGETLVHKKLPDYIAYMKEKRPLINTVVSTNAVPLTESMYRRLAEAGLDSLQLSLYAHSEQEYVNIVQADPKNFHRVMENVRNAGRIARELKAQNKKTPFMQAFIFGTKENEPELDDFIEEWSKHVDHAFVRYVYSAGRDISGMTPMGKLDIPEKRYPCIMPWYATGVDAVGNVYPCRFFQWYPETKNSIIGNIKDKPLKEIWQSAEFQKFRKEHLELDLKNHPVCQKCDSWSRYTNVFSEKDTGGYQYEKISVKDVFKKAPEYLGG